MGWFTKITKPPQFSHLSQAMQTVLVLFAQFETSAESEIVILFFIMLNLIHYFGGQTRKPCILCLPENAGSCPCHLVILITGIH